MPLINENVLITLKSAVTDTDLKLVCNSAVGQYANPQRPMYGQYLLGIVDDLNNPTVVELVRYDHLSVKSTGDVVIDNIQRAQDGTKARTWDVGAVVLGDLSLVDLTNITEPTPTDLSVKELQSRPRGSGFLNSTETTISFDDLTRTFTLGLESSVESTVYFSNTTKYQLRAPKTVVIDDVEGVHFIYLDGGSLKSTTVYSDALYESKTLVSAIYWNQTDSEAILVMDKRYDATMSSNNKIWMSKTIGGVVRRGLEIIPDSIAFNGTSTAYTFVVTDGELIVGNKVHKIANNTKGQQLDPIAQMPVYYRLGDAGDWKRVAASNWPAILLSAPGKSNYNQWTGSTWKLTQGAYYLVYIAATASINEPVIAILGQKNFGSHQDASDGVYANPTIDLGALSAISEDIKIIGCIIARTTPGFSFNPVYTRFESVNYPDIIYLDLRQSHLMKNLGFSTKLEVDKLFLTVAEPIGRGDIVAMRNDAGNLRAYLADANDPTKAPNYIAFNSLPNIGLFIISVDIHKPGLTVGPQYLDPLNPGQLTSTRPTSGKVWLCGISKEPDWVTFIRPRLMDILP